MGADDRGHLSEPPFLSQREGRLGGSQKPILLDTACLPTGVPPRVRIAGDVPHGSGDTSLGPRTASMDDHGLTHAGVEEEGCLTTPMAGIANPFTGVSRRGIG